MLVYRVNSIMYTKREYEILEKRHVNYTLFVGCKEIFTIYNKNNWVFSRLTCSNDSLLVHSNTAYFHSSATCNLLFLGLKINRTYKSRRKVNDFEGIIGIEVSVFTLR